MLEESVKELREQSQKDQQQIKDRDKQLQVKDAGMVQFLKDREQAVLRGHLQFSVIANGLFDRLF